MKYDEFLIVVHRIRESFSFLTKQKDVLSHQIEIFPQVLLRRNVYVRRKQGNTFLHLKRVFRFREEYWVERYLYERGVFSTQQIVGTLPEKVP